METRFLKKGSKLRTEFLRNNNRGMTRGINYTLNVLKEYFQPLLDSNQNIDSDSSNTHRNRSEEDKCEMESPNLDEVQEYIKSKKIKKVPGSSVIPSRLLRADAGEILIILHQILIKVWEEESKPDNLKRSNMHFVHQRSDAF
jgi:hypothetical protein